MTKSEAVQKAYQWALNTLGDKNSACMAMLLAKHILAAVERHNTREESFEPIVGLVREWHASRRESMVKLAKRLSKMMQIKTAEETVESS